MKVIDLLNKIANGEEVPKYITYVNRLNDEFETMMICKENIIYKLDNDIIELNSVVEVTEEEKKIPEKLSTKTPFDDKEKEVFILENRVKINEIIDYLVCLKSKGEIK